jgi:hypothetical protein
VLHSCYSATISMMFRDSEFTTDTCYTVTWQAWTCSSPKTYYWEQLLKSDWESSFNLLRWNIAFSCAVQVMVGIHPILPSTPGECSTVPLTYIYEGNLSSGLLIW